MSEDIEMFIRQARQVPSTLLKVEMIVYIRKWNVCPDGSQGNKIIIVFGETDTVHLLDREKKNHVNVSEIEAAVKKIMVIFLKVIIFGSYGMRCKWMLQEELMMFNLLIWRKT